MEDCTICKTETGGVSVQCDRCDFWVHVSCANLTERQVERIVNYFCDECSDEQHLTTWRRVRASERQKRIKERFYYEVREIRGFREGSTGREFLVGWQAVSRRGSSTGASCSWEPEHHLDGAIDLLQQYCRSNSLPLSEIEGLMGADENDEDTRIANWVSMSTILTTFTKYRALKLVRSNLGASEWTGFGEDDHLYFLKHGPHCFVVLYVASKQLAYIADGGNVYRKNQEVAVEIKTKLGVRLISLPFDQQKMIDHCGSSAVQIGLEMLRLYERGVKYEELICAKGFRNKLAKIMHKSESKPEAKRLERRLKWIKCQFCDKKFMENQKRALRFHVTNRHA